MKEHLARTSSERRAVSYEQTPSKLAAHRSALISG
jgi:hypothetical protein